MRRDVDRKRIKEVCGSLPEALAALESDRKFLTAGGVFDDDAIDAYLDLKYEEVNNFRRSPHPVEFDMYYRFKIVSPNFSEQDANRMAIPTICNAETGGF